MVDLDPRDQLQRLSTPRFAQGLGANPEFAEQQKELGFAAATCCVEHLRLDLSGAADVFGEVDDAKLKRGRVFVGLWARVSVRDVGSGLQ